MGRIYGYGVVDTENPQLVSAINNMIKDGYEKDTICRITGAPPEVVEHHQRRNEKNKPERTYTESELKEIVYRMQHEAKKQPREGKALAEILREEKS